MAKMKAVISPDELILEKEEKTAASALLESLGRTKAKDTRISVRVDDETLKAFRNICIKRSINGSNLLRGFIKSFVEENKDFI